MAGHNFQKQKRGYTDPCIKYSKTDEYHRDRAGISMRTRLLRIIEDRTSLGKLLTCLPMSVASIFAALLVMNIDIVQMIADYRSRVSNGSEIHAILLKESQGIHVSAYLFNVTNGEAFLRGEDHKLKLEEVGPFTYMEVRSNLDLEIDEAAGVLRYSPRVKPVFLLNESIADPREVKVSMPNIAMLGMSSMISSHGYLSQVAFSLLLDHLKSQAVVNLTAEEFLWGYDEPLITLGNTVLPGWISFETLGIMDRLYDKKVDYRLEVATDKSEKFQVKAMNGFRGLKVWDFEDPTKRTECNSFTGAYEGIAYPNQLAPGTPLKIFRNVLCRFLELDFKEKLTLDTGVEALSYKISNSTYAINNKTECLCGRGTCISGISDLSPCYYSLPLALSNAHFLDGDPKLFERLEGLNPNEEEHGSDILIEPKIGLVIKTAFSVQVNLVVNKVDFNSQAERFSEMVIPVCYFKLVQPELIEESKYNLKLMYIIGPNIMLGLQIFLFLLGLLLLAYCVHLILPRLVKIRSKGIIFQTPKQDKPIATKVPLIRS